MRIMSQKKKVGSNGNINWASMEYKDIITDQITSKIENILNRKTWKLF